MAEPHEGIKRGWWIYMQCCSGGGEGPQPPSRHAAVQRRLVLWVRWLLAELVVPLLRAHFYCTESEAYRQQVFYYRSALCCASDCTRRPHTSSPLSAQCSRMLNAVECCFCHSRKAVEP